MNPRKFYAPNSRDALKKVRETLGPNAVVLSNRPVGNGVEVIAVPETELARMADDNPVKTPPASEAPTRQSVGGFGGEPEPLPETPGAGAPTEPTLAPQAPSPAKPRRASVSEELLSEISAMKQLMETQLSLVAWGDLQRRDPDRVKLAKHLLNCGFSATLTRTLTEALPQKHDFETGLQWIRTVLNRNLNAEESGTEFVDQGGVYALVGPTGVGKTATTAKLAARYVLRHGTSRLALITMDSYRIGAHEQLRIYAKILGAPVYAVRDSADLDVKLTELSGKHMILIDTVGMSQRDQYLGEHLKILRQSRTRIKPLLLLNAGSAPSVLDDVVTAHQNALPIHGCILTKTDESAGLAPVLDLLVRRQLRLLFMTNGQRVPEDIYQPNRQYLLHKALKHDVDASPLSFDDDDLPLLMTDADADSAGQTRILGL